MNILIFLLFWASASQRWVRIAPQKGAFGVLCTLNKSVLLNVRRRGKINFQTGRAICSISKDFKRY